jgi:hypothetical protein
MSKKAVFSTEQTPTKTDKEEDNRFLKGKEFRRPEPKKT